MNMVSSALIKTAQYGAPADNMLILGENLDVLRNLSQEYLGKIQCIYLDPPYNSCQSFDLFEDQFSQEEWKTIMRERLDALWLFLSETGSIWISIDDSEFADLKVLCDTIWGRDKFLISIVRQKNKYPSSPERAIVHMHDYILVYAKNPSRIKLHSIPTEEGIISWDFPEKEWMPENILIHSSLLPPDKDISNYLYGITDPLGHTIYPPKGRCWRITQDSYDKLSDSGLIWFDQNVGFPQVKRYLNSTRTVRPTSLWKECEIGSNQEARREIFDYDMGMFFYVPKPERLLYRILSICTDPGDWVLDPFLGSGTTAAVAQKMCRKWIGIEQQREQFENLCIPRLKAVVEGKDNSSVTHITRWKGGGGFSCYSK